MLFILLISSSVLVWNTDAQSSQNPFGFGLFGNFDFDSLLFGNQHSDVQNGGGNDFGERGNILSRAYPRNTQQSNINNGYSDNNGMPSNQQRQQAAQVQYAGKAQSQQSNYHANSEQQSHIHQQKTQAQQQSYQQNSQYQQSNFQRNEQNSVYGVNAQSQPQTHEQNTQSQQQFYPQDTQPQQSLYQQNVQAQQKLYQQNAQAQQQLYQQNTQTQQQLYQQSGKPQQQLYQQNTQPQQQSYQQNAQPQQQPYQQKAKPQQQLYKQSQQSQIGFGTVNGADYYSQNRNGQTTSGSLSSRFNEDHTRTGPKQNGHYNNATFAITKFGLKMFKAMSRDFSNVVASPYSVAMLLALIQQGAQGDTQQEITQLLQLTPESSDYLFKTLTDTMRKRNSRNVFKVANNVVISNQFNINSKFKSTALNSFGSDVTRMNFDDPYGTTRNINEWVARKTNQKITNLLQPQAITQDTLAMLVNAVYFKGVWEKKFDPKMTTDKEFTLSDGTKKLVPFMEARRMFQTDIDPVLKSQILILPFEGTQYSMMFILPFEGVYAVDVLSSLTEPQLYAYQKLTAKEVNVEIPRFTVKKESDAYFILNLLGLWKIFGNEADLTGIGSHEGASPHITSGVHSALLSIDEQGGAAAAATAFSVVALSYDDPTTSFTANRPFLAILWDNELSMPLFMAKVEDPQA